MTEALEKLESLLNNQEELLPELKKHITFGCFDSVMSIAHPLVHEIFYIPQMNAVYNKQLLSKKEYLQKSLEKKDYLQYVFLHERPYRFDAFSAISNLMSHAEYWNLLRDVWVDSENLWQVGMRKIRELITSDRPERSALMTDDDKNLLNSLPSTVIVYRGHQGCNQRGWSWSLSKETARWFSARLSPPDPAVSYVKVKKSDILAVFTGRGEQEVVIDPRYKRIRNL